MTDMSDGSDNSSIIRFNSGPAHTRKHGRKAWFEGDLEVEAWLRDHYYVDPTSKTGIRSKKTGKTVGYLWTDSRRGEGTNRRASSRWVITVHGRSNSKGRCVRAKIHRVAFFLEHNRWPGLVDHVTGDALNNSSLQEITNTENLRKKRKTLSNTSGYSGVSWNNAMTRWQSGIKINSVRIYLGCFDDLFLAAEVAYRARLHAFGPGGHQMEDGDLAWLAEGLKKYDQKFIDETVINALSRPRFVAAVLADKNRKVTTAGYVVE